MPDESFLSQIKRLIVGAPIPSHLAHHERFSRVTGLAVLSSDPLSSVAYATEEILRVLTIGGVAALGLVTPIGAVIATMLAIVVFSYRQTIYAYPNGGGAYIVAKDNLGRLPSLIAASALLIDYVLTVSVSIAAGVAAITSALPAFHVNTRRDVAGVRVILMLGNLRGVRESGRLFAAPTYFFIVSILAMIAVGAWRYLTGTLVPMEAATGSLPSTHGELPLTTFTLAACLLEWLYGHDRRRSGLERRAGISAAREPQRISHAGGDGDPVDHDVPGHHAAGACLRHRAE